MFLLNNRTRARRARRTEHPHVPRLEVLEPRCLFANYTWAGPANGLWSTKTNWDPNGRPGPTDTVIFKKTDNNDSKMDLSTGASSRTVSELWINGYTGTIWLQRWLTIDVLTMSSGTIQPDSKPLEMNIKMAVRQDNNSRKLGPSNWTGGNIGGGRTLPLVTLGIPKRPMTFNLGSDSATPV